MESTRELLSAATEQLATAGVPNPEVDAELLLSHVTGRPRGMLRMIGTLTQDQASTYAELLAQRVQRIPLQHLTGLAPFRHLELRVGPGVFIPRPETELMVDHVLAFAAGRGPIVVDLGTGSGALALSIATELPGSRVFAVELSPAAVEWARGNIADHVEQISSVGSSIELIAADATRVAGAGESLEQVRGHVDVVVTNPPYVPRDAIPREPEVREHDPDLALYGGDDGLAVVRPITEQAALLLRPGGLLLIEHADVQGEEAGEFGVPALLRGQREPGQPAHCPVDPRTDGTGRASASAPSAWREVTDHLDLAGRPRHTAAIRAGGRMAP